MIRLMSERLGYLGHDFCGSCFDKKEGENIQQCIIGYMSESFSYCGTEPQARILQFLEKVLLMKRSVKNSVQYDIQIRKNFYFSIINDTIDLSEFL